VIQPRGKSLRIRVYAGRDPATGRERHLTRTTRAGQKTAERIERDLIRQVELGRTRDERVTVAELLARWLEHVERGLSPTTAEGYRRIIDKTLVPEFGKLPVEKLTGQQLDALYGKLQRQGLGESAVRHVHAVARSALGQAVKWGWLTVNPALAATPPTVPHHEHEIPTADDVRRLIAWAADPEHDPDLAVVVRLAACTGARRGEVAALRWTDIDLELGQVVIARALIAVKGRVIEKSTKTGKPRPVALDPATVAVLRAHRVREAEKALRFGVPLEPNAPVFTALPGRAWYPDTVTARYRKAARATGVETRFHDLRHGHVSVLLASGEQVLDVSKRVGHSSAKMTLEVYGHKIKARDQSAATAIAAWLDG
jgi:integrase